MAKPFKFMDNMNRYNKMLIVCTISMIKVYAIDYNESDGRITTVDIKLELPLEDKPINKVL